MKETKKTKVIKQAFDTLAFSEKRVKQLEENLRQVRRTLKRIETKKLPALMKKFDDFENFKADFRSWDQKERDKGKKGKKN